MTTDNTKHFSFIKNKKPISAGKVEQEFPRWTHYLNGYERPTEVRMTKVIAERLSRNNVLR